MPALKAASPPPAEEVEMTAVAVAAPSASAEAEELVKKLRAFVSLLADRIRKVRSRRVPVSTPLSDAVRGSLVSSARSSAVRAGGRSRHYESLSSTPAVPLESPGVPL